MAIFESFLGTFSLTFSQRSEIPRNCKMKMRILQTYRLAMQIAGFLQFDYGFEFWD